MQPQAPHKSVTQDIQNKSFYKALRANVAIGQAFEWDAAGNPSVFTQDNGDGILIRIGSNANPFGLTFSWFGTNVDTPIEHNLGRVPIGYYVTKKTITCDVYDGSVAPTDSTITLRCSDGTADTIVYIF